MVVENVEATAASQEKAANRETFSQEAGQEWVAANPGIVRTVLAAYPYVGKTVLMSRDELKAGKRASNYV